MNLLDQLTFARTSENKTEKPKPKNKPWLSRQKNVTEKYRQIMVGQKLTTSQVASRAGISHMGALTYLYELEKRKLVKRDGIMERPENAMRGRGQIIWAWCENTEREN